MFVTVPTYFNYQQCQSVNDAGPMTSYSMLRDIENMRVLDIHDTRTKPIVTAYAYSNYFQYRTMENAGPIERYHVMLQIKDQETTALNYGLVKLNDKTQGNVINMVRTVGL